MRRLVRFEDRRRQFVDADFDRAEHKDENTTTFWSTTLTVLLFTYLSSNESGCEKEFVKIHHDRSSSWWVGGFVCALWLICELQNRRSTNTQRSQYMLFAAYPPTASRADFMLLDLTPKHSGSGTVTPASLFNVGSNR